MFPGPNSSQGTFPNYLHTNLAEILQIFFRSLGKMLPPPPLSEDEICSRSLRERFRGSHFTTRTETGSGPFWP